MHIVNRVHDILNRIDVKHFYLRKKEDADSYIIFYIFDEKGVSYSAGNENITAFYIQVSVFTKDETEWLDLQEKVRSEFKLKKDWELDDISPDMFEKDTKYNHKAFRYVFYKNNKIESEE